MGHVLRDEDEGACGRLVDVVVGVERRAFAGRGGGLERAQPAPRLRADGLELDRASDRVPHGDPLAGTHDQARRVTVAHPPTLLRTYTLIGYCGRNDRTSEETRGGTSAVRRPGYALRPLPD